MPLVLYSFLGVFLTFLVIAEFAGSLWSFFWEYVS